MSSPTSTGASDVTSGVTNVFRVTLGLAGLVALILGVLILVWPGRTAVVVTALIAIYAIIVGIVYAALTFFAKDKGGWWRVGHAILAVLFIAAGISAFSSLHATTAFLAVFLGIAIGVLWIAEGVVSLSLIGRSASKGWTAFYAIVSIIAGIVLFVSPLWSIVVLWWIVGISLVVLGLVQIGRAFTFGRGARA